VWVLLAVLSGCGNSDPKNTGGGGQSPGSSGSAAELGGSTSSEAGSTGAPGGRAGVSGGGSSGAHETAGASNHAGGAAGSSAEAPPDIPSSTLLSDLDETQQGALCDWHASVFGGYGHSVQCGMGTVVFSTDQAACISMTFPGFCKKATVGDFDACVTAEIPGHGCIVTDECLNLFCP